MGAVGIGPFDNDGAGDLCVTIRSLGRDKAIGVLGSALAEVAESEPFENLDKDYAEEAIAASAIILARLRGDSKLLQEQELLDLIPEIPDSLIEMAVVALRRTVLSVESSEVYALWEDAGGGPDWKSGVELLASQLEQAQTSGRS